MKILVCGGRDFADYTSLCAALFSLHETTPIACLVHGGCSGADQLAARWALEQGIPAKAYPADWSRYGRSAGPRRNQQMLDSEPDIALVVAFSGGRGTQNMLELAQKKGLKVLLF